MSEAKWLHCVQRKRDPHDPERALAELPPPEARAWSVDVVGGDQDLLTLHSQPAQTPVRFELLSWQWGALPPVPSEPSDPVYRVREFPVFDELPARGENGRRPGVKQVSFLCRAPGLGVEEFRELYRHHVETLRDDQPGIAKYVQNVVDQVLVDGQEIDGVSELWFASLEDFRERYWSGPGVAEREAMDTGRFLDFTRTWSLIVREMAPTSSTTDR